jgi:hypothetical protein
VILKRLTPAGQATDPSTSTDPSALGGSDPYDLDRDSNGVDASNSRPAMAGLSVPLVTSRRVTGHNQHMSEVSGWSFPPVNRDDTNMKPGSHKFFG